MINSSFTIPLSSRSIDRCIIFTAFFIPIFTAVSNNLFRLIGTIIWEFPHEIYQKADIDSTDSSIGTAIGGITSISQTPTLKTVNLSGITVLSGQTLYIRVYPYNRPNIYWNGGTFHIKHGTTGYTAIPSTDGPTITGIVSNIADPITTWNGEAGWSNGVPTITRDAIIDADYNVVSNEVLAIKNLTINENAKVTVARDGMLLIQNNVTIVPNNLTDTPRLIIENNGSFVQVNDNATFTGATNSFEIKRNLAFNL